MNSRFEEVLRASALMRFVPEAHQARLRERFTEERYEFGEVIVRQGDERTAVMASGAGEPTVGKIGRERAQKIRPSPERPERLLTMF